MSTNASNPGRAAPKSSGAERRRWARRDTDLPVQVALGGLATEARVRDISRAGVCFYLDRPIPMMTVLEVSLALRTKKGEVAVRAHGAVVRCEKISKAVEHYEIAVFLHEMGDRERHAIEEFVAEQVLRA